MVAIKHYFVDEAGDGTLFGKRGRVLVGSEGCSRYFILGLVDIPEPDNISQALQQLRADLLSDPYFRGVPSMHPDARKTASAFHAKDDLPEVRREVLSLLARSSFRFFAVVRDKQRILDYVRQRNERDASYHYHTNELYDALVRRLFKNLLHKDDTYQIYFAKRGASDRTEALLGSLSDARIRFAEQWGKPVTSTMSVIPCTPTQQV